MVNIQGGYWHWLHWWACGIIVSLLPMIIILMLCWLRLMWVGSIWINFWIHTQPYNVSRCKKCWYSVSLTQILFWRWWFPTNFLVSQFLYWMLHDGSVIIKTLIWGLGRYHLFSMGVNWILCLQRFLPSHCCYSELINN